MRRLHISRGLPLALLITLLSALILQSRPAVPASTPAPPRPPGTLPVAFEPNAGQADPMVRYLAQTPGGTFLFTTDQVVLAVARSSCAGADCAGAVDPTPRCATRGGKEAAPPPPGLVRLRFDDSLPAVVLKATTPLPGRASYIEGNDPAQWQTDLPTYAGLTYSGLYPGIDLHYDGMGTGLKGTYTVGPGADPGRIRWRYEGATGVRLDGDGNLRYTVEGAASVTEHAPVAWQEHAGGRVAVSVRYTLDDEGEVGFALGQYDPAQPLTIDPMLIYATYLGGSGEDNGWALTMDSAGNTYIVGETTSPDFPMTGGGYQPNFGGGFSDVFVIKLDPKGNVVYATYLGGRGEDTGLGIAVDGAGRAYLVGSTGSPNFPLMHPVQGQYGGGNVDAFVTELNAAGTALVYSTFLGGDLDDCTVGISPDGAGNIYTAGYTASTNYPTVNAIQPTNGGSWDAFATKLGAQGATILYSTYLGGSDYELLSGFARDVAGNTYLTGETGSTNFPTHNAFQPANGGGDDVFVAKLSADGGTLRYATYLGGSGEDENWGVAVDGAGNAYVSGTTESPNFPTHNAYQPQYGGDGDAFVTKLNATGTGLVYSTYLGGSSEDAGRGIGLDKTGVVYLGGATASANFPLVEPIQPVYAGAGDAFAARLSSSGSSLLYSTYIGGTGADESRGLVTDAAGNVYLTGFTTSLDFPLAGAYQGVNAGGHDVFALGLSPRTLDPIERPNSPGK